MSTNFISSFLMRSPKSTISNAVQNIGISSVSGTQFVSLINHASSILSNNMQVAAEVLPSLYSSSEFCLDNDQLSADLDHNTFADYQIEISDDSAQLILDAIGSATAFSEKVNGSVNPNPGITLSDSKGVVYEIIPYGNISNLADTIIIATCSDPQSKHDALIYRENGRLYLNNLVRSKGYYEAGAPVSELDTIYDYILSIVDWGEFSSPSTTIYPSVLSIYRELSNDESEVDILSATQWIAGYYDISPRDTILDNLILIRQHLVSEQSEESYGYVGFYPDIISDVYENDAINSALYEAVTELKKGNFTSANYFSACDNLMPDARASVKRVMATITEAFNDGGPIATAKVIIQMLSASTSIVNENGSLSFTDNSNLVPQQYIAGIVCTVVGSIASVASLIATIFAPVVGVALSILSTGLLAIPRAVSYDYQTAANAKINADSDFLYLNNCTLPLFPHGLWQTEMLKSWCHPIYQEMFASGSIAFMLSIPGGYVFVGPSEDEDHIRCEFHPAVCWTPNIQCGRNEEILTHGTSSSGNYRIWWVKQFAPLYPLAGLKKIYACWAQADTLNISYDSNGYITSDFSDVALRWAFMKNISLAYSFLCLNSNEDEWRTQWLYRGSVILRRVSNYSGPTNQPAAWFFNTLVDDNHQSYYGNGNNFNIIPYLTMDPNDFYKLKQGTYFSTEKFPGKENQCHRLNTDSSTVFDTQMLPSWTKIAEITAHTGRLAEQDIMRFEAVILPGGIVPSQDHIDEVYYGTIGLPHSGTNFLVVRGHFGDVMEIPDKFSYMVSTPKYDKSTFIFWVIVSAIVTVAAIIATVICTVSVKKKIAMKQAMNAAKVEKAWSAATTNPTEENIRAYKKAVFKNNLFATVTGGTKYSKTGFWNAAESSEPGSSSVLSSAKSQMIAADVQSNGSPKGEANVSTIRSDINSQIRAVGLKIDPNFSM